ncbi:MAG: MotA/TolQ/ExbB proton channel family protein [Deltaproteobacteria bacterium]|nr:MotA/TolQ/ExbB proton channel family protein [Candidatus Anaeroferrophillus wilburensis]MBN2889878.1 MotA/TolQ/ExbB proton channel family protein [Deltaproteobacteria bacterium]
MYQFVIKGGVLMYPILICSVLSVAILLERIWALRRSKIIPNGFIIEIGDLLKRQKLEESMTLCRLSNTPISRILLTGIKNFGKQRELVKEAVEEVGRMEAAALERFLTTLGTIAGIAPLLGLLGTVTGMIKAFTVISQSGVGNPQLLAGGISEALITTAAGLTVAIPSFVFYKYLRSRVDKMILRMERISIDILDLFENQREV